MNRKDHIATTTLFFSLPSKKSKEMTIRMALVVSASTLAWDKDTSA